jgi:hypothetical protein
MPDVNAEVRHSFFFARINTITSMAFELNPVAEGAIDLLRPDSAQV